MNPKRKKLLAVGTAAAALAAVMVTLAAADLPPFTKQGAIEATAVCKSLGRESGTVGHLRDVLPKSENYTFEDRDLPRNDDFFLSSCDASADGKTFLNIDAELEHDNPVGTWAKRVVANQEPWGSRQAATLNAGKRAFSGERFAAVYVPCLSDGQLIGGGRSLSVVATAGQPSAEPEVAERSLKALLLDAARHAHARAKCDLPSKLPRDS